MTKHVATTLRLSGLAIGLLVATPLSAEQFDLPLRGPFPVSSTNMELATPYANASNEIVHQLLLGPNGAEDASPFLAETLQFPDAAWLTDVVVPADEDIYGPAQGQTLPVVTFITYPTAPDDAPNEYRFPYEDGRYGVFENMLRPDEAPKFADPNARYPLIILAHGAESHGLYDVDHAHRLASHGYIVAVITYGDGRTYAGNPSHHVGFLRPYMTTAVLDSILESQEFGPHVDTDNIGISGHSYGGFTALAAVGGRYNGRRETAMDARIAASVIAAPWVGHDSGLGGYYAFGPDNTDLRHITVPVICFFGTKDDVTRASYILPAMQKLSGPTYVVELVDQPHIFDGGGWRDRDKWELLFFSAYLKADSEALKYLRTIRSMAGGSEDVQRYEFQQLPEPVEELSAPR
ncbi:MAG: hypothetical protein AAFX44_08330 [Pseudomonadota bacterium]